MTILSWKIIAFALALFLAIPSVAAQSTGRIPEVVASWEADSADPLSIGANRTLTLRVTVDCSSPGALPSFRATISKASADQTGLVVRGGEPMTLDASVCPGAPAQATTELQVERTGGPGGEAGLAIVIALESLHPDNPLTQDEATASGILLLAEVDPTPENENTPGPALLLMLALVGCAAALRRRAS